VVLTFTSPRYETGKAVTLGVLALAMLAIGAGLVLDRRRRV
jgi:LPXTG-motif cell wall-anchored protein